MNNNCEYLKHLADERDAAERAANIAATPERLREAAFHVRADGRTIFSGYSVSCWMSAGMKQPPGNHPCFDTLVRFSNRELSSETEAMVRAEFDEVIRWCMTEPAPKRKNWWAFR